MQHRRLVQNCRLLGVSALSIATVLVGAPVVGTPVAQAAPTCKQWQFIGEYSLRQDDGLVVSFTQYGPSGQFVDVFSVAPNGEQQQGKAEPLNIIGRNFQMIVYWGTGDSAGDDVVTRYLGTVNNDTGFARGAVKIENTRTDEKWNKSWDANVPLGCADAPPPPKLMAEVIGGDAKVYNIAADEVVDENGISGVQIGTLFAGQQVKLEKPCNPNEWCMVLDPALPGGRGFVRGNLKFF
jgi:hypothetical protein